MVNLYRADGTIKTHYEYDSWGRVLSVTDENGNPITAKDNIGHVNPIRYRGYYYDAETGLYYLKSRYYDPELGRFVSSEPNVDYGEFDEGTGMLAYNVYAYCCNNPVCLMDEDGCSATVAAVGGWYLAGSIGGANFWNPLGWIIIGVTVVTAVCVIGYSIYNYSKAQKAEKKKTAKKSGKAKADDAPDWAKRQKYNPKKSADKNARDVLDKKYGKGRYKTGPGSEFSKIKKWLQRSKNYK